MPTPLIITLDGPAGVGKSTLAGRVAQALGIAYLDTGAMFRTVALAVGEAGLHLTEAELQKRLNSLHFSLSGTGSSSVLACNGHPAGRAIHTEAVGLTASRLATLPSVRTAMKKSQQALGRKFSLVAEGRDMGSVIFPHARFKFFLDAGAKVRALRRLRQLEESGAPQDLDVLTEQIRKRDDMDRQRAVAPLTAAPDACIIHTDHLDIQEVFQTIMACIKF
jgi:cytidylate kinase